MDLTFSVEHDYKDIKDKEDKPIFLIVAFSKWHNNWMLSPYDFEQVYILLGP